MPAKRASQITLTSAYYAAFITLGFVSAAIGPALPTFVANTASRLDQVSLLFVARSAGYLIGSFQSGKWYDRFPGHLVMAGVLVAMAALMSSLPMVPWLPLLAGAILLLGVTNGALDVGGNTLLVWVHTDRVGPFMNGLHLAWGVGAFLSPLIVATSLKLTTDIDVAFWVMGLLMLPAAVWLFSLPSPSVATQQAGPSQAAGPAPVLLASFVIFLALFAGSEAGFGAWIYTYALKIGLGTEQTAASLNSAYWAALTVGRFLGIPIATRVAPQRIVVVDLAVALASISLIVFLPGSSSALWLGTVGLGVSLATVFPMALAQAGRSMVMTGKVSRWFFVGASAGGMSIPWLIGQLFERVGTQVAMGTIGAALTLDVLVYALLLRQLRQRAGEGSARV